jgi:ribulose-bisphosphate carboxylase large chain
MEEFFDGRGKEWDKKEYVVATYSFESPLPPLKAALNLCREQSIPLWKIKGKEVIGLKEKHGARLVELKEKKTRKNPSIPAEFIQKKLLKGRFYSAKAKVIHPWKNFEEKISNLLTVLAGEGIFDNGVFSAIKLQDIEFPKNYLKKFPGPRFGLKETRKALNVKDRPIFVGVIKPNIGLKPKRFAEIAFEAMVGGLDIVKDDEMNFDTKRCPAEKRIKAVMEKVFKAEQETGEKKIYLVNITDEGEKVNELYDLVQENDGKAVMLCTIPVGFSKINEIRKKRKLLMFSHFPMLASFTRLKNYGISSHLMVKLQRMAGFDAILFPGFGGRLSVRQKEVKENIQECLKPLGNLKQSFPGIGGAYWAGMLPRVYSKIKTNDVMFVLGSGVFAHPLGPKAGALSVRQAWEAIKKRKPLKEYAVHKKELRTAMEFFG